MVQILRRIRRKVQVQNVLHHYVSTTFKTWGITMHTSEAASIDYSKATATEKFFKRLIISTALKQ